MNVSVRMLCFNIVIFLCSCVGGFLIDVSSSPLQNSVGTHTSPTDCSFKPVDVVFLLDSSGSIGLTNFNQIKNFVKSFVESSVIGPSNVQVSVVTFSTTVIEHFNLSRYHYKWDLLIALNAVHYVSGSTHTSEAILYAVQHSFTDAAGDRPLVSNFLVVVTDGQSIMPTNTKEAANLAHQAGIITFAIGIGSSVSSQELQDIATDSQHVFQIQTFGAISELSSELTTNICKGIKPFPGRCSGGSYSCHHVCLSTGKYNCIAGHYKAHHDHHHSMSAMCECLPKDYCDHRFSCTPTDVVCLHNESIRCNGNNTCECYCSQDSQCHNCPAGTLGFCVNEKCVCETNNYCPGRNKFYCLKNFQCAHSESKRCNHHDRCKCFCDTDTDCKNCPEKGFCVHRSCVCESQDYCPKGNHMYCLDRRCDRGYTSKCNSTNHCYCAYVPDTCSNQDVSKCYHLTCLSGEKKYCEGRTCTCKPLDYCQQNDGDCQHKICDALKAEVNVCLNGTCGCLAIPDLCSGDDTSTCQHIICNQYQVKKCENGVCKCQVNPSCNAREGLNDSCTPENTYLEVKGSDGESYYANCTDSFHYPLCVDDRCQCVYWKTPPPLLTAEGTTIPTSSMTDVAGSTVSSTVTSHKTEAMTKSSTPIATVATCATRLDCNQQNTHLTFPTFTMPCPVDHIDCVDNQCFCSIDKITTSRAAGTTTQTVSTLTASSTSVGNTASATNTTPLSTSHLPLTTTTTAQKVSPTTASQTSAGSTASTTHTTPLSTSHPTLTTTTSTGLMCPECDENLICSWTRDCYPGQVCMIRQFNRTLTVHCSEKNDCNFMKKFVPEILCCKDIQCINNIII